MLLFKHLPTEPVADETGVTTCGILLEQGLFISGEAEKWNLPSYYGSLHTGLHLAKVFQPDTPSCIPTVCFQERLASWADLKVHTAPTTV